jgi:transposase-like protein
MTKTCKRCFSINVVQNGKVREKQRYKCKDCGFNFVEGDKRERTRTEAKALALIMYGSCKASYGMIAKLFKVSRTTVLNWIRTMGKKLPEPEFATDIKEIQMDEMWHFINKKNKKYGSGEPWIVLEIEPSDGLLAIVMLRRFVSSMKS